MTKKSEVFDLNKCTVQVLDWGRFRVEFEQPSSRLRRFFLGPKVLAYEKEFGFWYRHQHGQVWRRADYGEQLACSQAVSACVPEAAC